MAQRNVLVTGGMGGLGESICTKMADAGYKVTLFERKPYLGGRASSYEHPGTGETVDNCQHVLLRCCVNLLDLYRRLDVAADITFHKEFFFIEPGGRISILKAGGLPRPFHFAGSFLKMRCLGLGDKLSLGRAMLALQRERTTRADLDHITMLQWLTEKGQTKRAIDRFWSQVLVSAINEDLDRMSAIHGFQVFWLGFLASSTSYEMGIPNVPLGDLYGSAAWQQFPGVRIHLRSGVDRLGADGVIIRGEARTADYYVSTLPFEKLTAVAPELEAPQFAHSPITGIHLWFDRPITALPHAVLLDRTVQWMFNKDGGTYLQLVVSASRSLIEKSRGDVIALAIKELAEFFPEVSRATLVKAHVVKEVRATFSAAPGLELQRPGNRTRLPNVFLAGDWTRSGWPATMEGAVRSGYLAAEAVTAASGKPKRFLLPDIA